ncbi:isopentenyl-diphosphate Delta-isomerase [Brachybacterium nesterenkovii]|uniref:Isopentenyl-diphosphate Delta-isomerase n=1 Tax=Brachybacterium nesterenkovii TaxID=47847 RepID=A0A1X6X4N8_9MICO|nr:isopentenyl-diphosphate Delta-isomerase [Brachybacterium nesterenkovii]SLM93816.1 Isopentenyl-diphosphate delta-isomerase [Brachybacterium nesterenkovii]
MSTPPASSTSAPWTETVVLLDASGAPNGTAPKATVHTTDTPLHLAFSLHLRDARGRVLLTRRALSKRTWPGVWTNTVCGHPAPGEDTVDAVLRRCGRELHLDPALISPLRPIGPHFRYRAVDASGIVENEVCPVLLAEYAGDPDALPHPAPDEVMDHAWAHVDDVAATARNAPFLLSPWLVGHLADPEILAALERPAP